MPLEPVYGTRLLGFRHDLWLKIGLKIMRPIDRK